MSNAAPLPTAISQTCALHHVTVIVAFVPLVADSMHHAIVGGANLLVGCRGKETVKRKRKKKTELVFSSLRVCPFDWPVACVCVLAALFAKCVFTDKEFGFVNSHVYKRHG